MSQAQLNDSSIPLINHVTVTGGTHGNEVTGVHIIKHFQPNASHSFKSTAFLANPPACQALKRYIDKDLNRCFQSEVLSNTNESSLWEVKRAKQIIQTFNQPDDPTDFIIDLHTTTANMGVTLIFEQANWLTYCILKHVQDNMPNVNFMYEPCEPNHKSPYLISSAPQGIMIEVGPVAQGLLEPASYELTRQALDKTLAAIEFYNRVVCPNPQEWVAKTASLSLQIHQSEQYIAYPKINDQESKDKRHENKRHEAPTMSMMIHPDFQGNDYKLLKSGMPIFKDFSGQTHYFTGSDCYPVFINEAAYYDTNLAFTCAKRFLLDFNHKVPAHRRRTDNVSD